MENKSYWHKKIQTPIGAIDLVADDKNLLVVQMENHSHDHLIALNLQNGTNHKILKKTEKQLAEYFAGDRKSFDLPISFQGSEFQNQVWKELLKIPYGKSITYGMQAAQIGRPGAARAVGACNGKNPLSIVVPCHRVIGASGALTGYAGGLEIKRRLFKLEGLQL